MTITDMRNKNIEELRNELLVLLKEQLNLRIQRGSEQPPKAHLFRRIKTNIARIKTILKEKGIIV